MVLELICRSDDFVVRRLCSKYVYDATRSGHATLDRSTVSRAHHGCADLGYLGAPTRLADCGTTHFFDRICMDDSLVHNAWASSDHCGGLEVARASLANQCAC